jgi:hypothetical protein
MKANTGVVSRSKRGVRQPKRADPARHAVGELAHDLFNQLTVINLCSAQLSASVRGTGDNGVAANLDMLERSAEEATRLAERIAQTMGEWRTHAVTASACGSTAQPPTQKHYTTLLDQTACLL